MLNNEIDDRGRGKRCIKISKFYARNRSNSASGNFWFVGWAEQRKWKRKEDEKEGKNFRNNVARFDRLNVKQGINEAAKRGG